MDNDPNKSNIIKIAPALVMGKGILKKSKKFKEKSIN